MFIHFYIARVGSGSGKKKGLTSGSANPGQQSMNEWDLLGGHSLGEKEAGGQNLEEDGEGLDVWLDVLLDHEVQQTRRAPHQQQSVGGYTRKQIIALS